MGRAEKRRAERADKKGKTATYQYTKQQLDDLIHKTIENDILKIKKEAMEEAINTAMTLMLVLPMEVLMDHYWIKSYAQKIPKFTELVLEYYQKWQIGELDMEKMEEDLWEYGGIKLVEERLEHETKG